MVVQLEVRQLADPKLQVAGLRFVSLNCPECRESRTYLKSTTTVFVAQIPLSVEEMITESLFF